MRGATHSVVKLLLEGFGVAERRQTSIGHRFIEAGLIAILGGPSRPLFHVTMLAVVIKPKPDKLLVFWISQERHQDVASLMKGAPYN